MQKKFVAVPTPHCFIHYGSFEHFNIIDSTLYCTHRSVGGPLILRNCFVRCTNFRNREVHIEHLLQNKRGDISTVYGAKTGYIGYWTGTGGQQKQDNTVEHDFT